MTERHRITRIKSTTTKSGKPVVELYDRDTRLEFPVLRLFAFDELRTVGINPASLEPEATIHVNFWAYYELSEKMTSKGNPYKDVLHLEAIDQPATATSTDTSALLAEVRRLIGEVQAIKALLLAVQPPTTEADPAAKIARVRALAGVGSNSDPQATEPQGNAGVSPAACEMCGLPECESPSRCALSLFNRLAGPAIAEGRIQASTVTELAKSANGEGWEGALAKLREALNAAA